MVRQGDILASMPTDRLATLQDRLKPLLVRVEGQYPRPWMLSSSDPDAAQVFIVGHHWAKRYPADRIRLDDYLASHWNPSLCRKLYDDVTDGEASQTRREQDTLAEGLRFAGVLETNVICFSPPNDGKLSSQGIAHGIEIFNTVLGVIRPRVLIMYGQNTIDAAKSIGLGKLRIPDRSTPDPNEPTMTMGIELQRANLRRRYPDESDAEIQARLQRWLDRVDD